MLANFNKLSDTNTHKIALKEDYTIHFDGNLQISIHNTHYLINDRF